MGASTSTTKPSNTTSKTTMYIVQRIAKTSHHRWGEVCRQVLIDVYSSIWAVKNQLRVINEQRSVSLKVNVRTSEKKCWIVALNLPRIGEVMTQSRGLWCSGGDTVGGYTILSWNRIADACWIYHSCLWLSGRMSKILNLLEMNSKFMWECHTEHGRGGNPSTLDLNSTELLLPR